MLLSPANIVRCSTEVRLFEFKNSNGSSHSKSKYVILYLTNTD